MSHTLESDGYTLNFDGGLEGHVHITRDADRKTFLVPASVLLDFAAEWRRGRLIAQIEEMEAEELLLWPFGAEKTE
jgi:hypothetical protein